jgi:predicted MFS family arabinose efflux permease
VVALVSVALAPTATMMLTAMAAVGLLAVVTQVLVAYAAILAPPAERGRAVGIVTSGIIVGILLARSVAGTLSDLSGWRSVYLFSAVATLAVSALLFKALPRQAAAAVGVTYPKLIGSVFMLFVEEPVLRIRAVLALLIFAAITMLLTPMVLPLAAAPFSLSHTQIGLFWACRGGRLRLEPRVPVAWLTAVTLSGRPASAWRSCCCPGCPSPSCLGRSGHWCSASSP